MDEPRRKSGGIATMHSPQKQWGHAEWLLLPPKEGKPLLYPAGATNPAFASFHLSHACIPEFLSNGTTFSTAMNSTCTLKPLQSLATRRSEDSQTCGGVQSYWTVICACWLHPFFSDLLQSLVFVSLWSRCHVVTTI